MKEYVSVDVETTGLAPKQDKIIEIGAVRVRDGQIVGSFTCFVNPGRILPAHITELTGILQRMGYSKVNNIGGIAAYSGKVEK